jgi:hypothetical protein
MTVLNDMTPYLSLMQLGGVISDNCPDPDLDEGSPMTAAVYGSRAQIECIQRIRGSIQNDSWDFVEIAEEMIADAGPGPPLFNVIVAMYTKWSRHWKVENPEPPPDSSYASVSSSRASSRTPQPHPFVSQGHSATPSPRPRPGPHGGAYRHSAHGPSVTPPPRHSPPSAGGHASRAHSRSRTPPRASSDPRTARSHMDAALLSLKALQL